MASEDQHFLLYFITGAYFGPDIKEERPLKSILQRKAEKLPLYTLDQLAGSQKDMAEVECVYYNVLQNLEKSLSVSLLLFHHFIDGTMITFGNHDPPADYPLFPDLFPPELHPLSELDNKSKMIQNVVFIRDPDISCLKPKDIERFKRLTGLDNLVLDRAAVVINKPEDDNSFSFDIPMEVSRPAQELPALIFHTSKDDNTSSYDMLVEAAQPVVELPPRFHTSGDNSTLHNMPKEVARPIQELPPAFHTSADNSTSHDMPVEGAQPIGELHPGFHASSSNSTSSNVPVQVAQPIRELRPGLHTSSSTSTSSNVPVQAAQPITQRRTPKLPHPRKVRRNIKGQNQSVHDVAPLRSVPPPKAISRAQMFTSPLPTGDDNVTEEMVGPPKVLMMPSSPKKEEWAKIKLFGKDILSLTGSAVTGKNGPYIGLLDTGESSDSYMFRVALPGVKNDENENCFVTAEDFSCVVDTDGKVQIKGVTTTGEDIVKFHSLKFQMMTKNLCPPGEFNLTFNLPGPVNPQQFRGNFMDGMLEGIVMKQKKEEDNATDCIMTDA